MGVNINSAHPIIAITLLAFIVAGCEDAGKALDYLNGRYHYTGYDLDGNPVVSGTLVLLRDDGNVQGQKTFSGVFPDSGTSDVHGELIRPDVFTALAILQLRDNGKLSLDDPASKYIPEMKNLKYLTTDAPEITIRHLLTHGAGFPEDNPWGDRQLADSDAELRKLMADGPSFSNAPGVEYEYSNVGFALLGQIVQVVSGMDFESYTSEHIFKPLGMKNTVWEYEKRRRRNLRLVTSGRAKPP